MKTKPSLLPALLVLALLPAAAAAGPAAARGKPDFEGYGSCANGKPFKAARTCHYDRARYFRATFVLESHVGKRPVKACFRAFGAKPIGGGHGCAKLGKLAYKAYPFKITGVRQAFSVKVTWYAKESGDDFAQVAASFMRVVP